MTVVCSASDELRVLYFDLCGVKQKGRVVTVDETAGGS